MLAPLSTRAGVVSPFLVVPIVMFTWGRLAKLFISLMACPGPLTGGGDLLSLPSTHDSLDSPSPNAPPPYSIYRCFVLRLGVGVGVAAVAVAAVAADNFWCNDLISFECWASVSLMVVGAMASISIGSCCVCWSTLSRNLALAHSE